MSSRVITTMSKAIKEKHAEYIAKNFFEPKVEIYIFKVEKPSKYDGRGEVVCPVCGLIWRSIVINTDKGWYFDAVDCKGPEANRLYHEIYRRGDRYRYNTTGVSTPVTEKIYDAAVEWVHSIPAHAIIVPPLAVRRAIKRRENITPKERSGIIN